MYPVISSGVLSLWCQRLTSVHSRCSGAPRFFFGGGSGSPHEGCARGCFVWVSKTCLSTGFPKLLIEGCGLRERDCTGRD